MHAARNWALYSLGTAIAVAVCYLWLDRPIALIAHAEFARYELFEKLTLIPNAIIPLGILLLVVLAMHSLGTQPLSRLLTVILLSGVSFAVNEVIKDRLKYAFGRTWPETWVHENPSFIHDHVFGFFPFHGGPGYESFPSGHTSAICSVMSVLWVCYPRWRAAYAVCIAAVAIGLVGADFHFLGDVIAGGFLGCLVGTLMVALWENGTHPVRPPGQTPK